MDDVRRLRVDDDASQRIGIERVGHGRRRTERAQRRRVRRGSRQRRHLVSGRRERSNQRHADRAAPSRQKDSHDALRTRTAWLRPMATPAASIAASSAAVDANRVRQAGAT